jgi:glutamate-1-semialdehyde 2,1-aminomutase
LEFARLVVDAVESLEMVRFVSSGTEAVMSAVRLARGFSGKDKIVAFEGGYHGHFDSVLSSQSHQSSTGIPQALAQNTILLPFGDLSAVEVLLKEKNKEIACVLVEPVPGSMTVIETEPAYLQGLRTLCTKYGVLLVFDEVITGFRLARGGAQEYFKVNADLTCYGKALAGGMPVGAYGGSKEIMRSLMPEGKVYQAGTFSGNPLTMAAGIAVLRELENPQNYKKLESLGQLFFDLLNKQIKTNSWPVQLQRVGSMFSIVFSAKPVHSFADTQMIDAACYARFFHYCLDSGLYMPPSAVDAACFSMAHQQADMETAASIMLLALKKCFETKT